MTAEATVHTWQAIAPDHPMPRIDRRLLRGQHAMLSHVTLHRGFKVEPHAHPNEQFAVVLSGRIRFTLGEPAASPHEVELVGGQVLQIPPNVRHGAEAIETTVILDVFSPPSAKTGVDRS
jgi:quercetin dioxygenase-like cupin family protein